MIASLDAEKAFGNSKTHPGLGGGWHGRRDWSFQQVKDKRGSASKIVIKKNPLLTKSSWQTKSRSKVCHQCYSTLCRDSGHILCTQHSIQAQVREHHEGVSSLLLPWRCWELNSTHLAWWQAHLPTGSSSQPNNMVFKGRAGRRNRDICCLHSVMANHIENFPNDTKGKHSQN